MAPTLSPNATAAATPRIIALLPSVTEILFSVGAGPYVVGVTHECDYPPEVKALPKCTSSLLAPNLTAAEIDTAVTQSLLSDVQSVYALDARMVERLRPTLIVTQSLCEVCAVPRKTVDTVLCSVSSGTTTSIISSDPHNLDHDLYDTIEEVGSRVSPECHSKAKFVVTALKARVAQCIQRSTHVELRKPNVMFLEWPDPPFMAGHWVPQQMQYAGANCVRGVTSEPSFRVQWPDLIKDIEETPLDFIICAFCGYDLYENQHQIDLLEQRGHEQWKTLTKVPTVYAVNANAFFSRPGPRLVDGMELLSYIFHGTPQYKPEAIGSASKLTDSGWVDIAT